MTLKFENSVTKKEYNFSVTDKNTSKILYNFDIHLEEGMDDGSYNYWLYDDDEDDTLLAQGLVQIGDFKQENKTYTKEENGYKYYEG